MSVAFFNRKRNSWIGKPSIYSFIKEQGQVLDGTLPDDDEYWADSPIRWVAGAQDGVFGHHMAEEEITEKGYPIIRLLVKQSSRPNELRRSALYHRLSKLQISSVIDHLLQKIVEHPSVNFDGLYQEAKWLVQNGAHRNSVKFGLALLGLFKNDEEKELILSLGRHEEFTLYAAVAIQNGTTDGNKTLFELAQQVHGWGKIHLVERLEPNNDEIKNWLLRDGCCNTVMNEYLASICARRGELHKALAVEKIDAQLMDGASDIIEALLAGGPAEDIYDYEYGAQVLADYIRLFEKQCASFKHLLTVFKIRDFLNEHQDNESLLSELGWVEQQIADTMSNCEKIIADDNWRKMILHAVATKERVQNENTVACVADNEQDYYMMACAEKLEIDI